MTFLTEEARHAFHVLPTQVQYDWLNVEELLATMGYEIQVGYATDGIAKDGKPDASPCLEVRIRIFQQHKPLTL